MGRQKGAELKAAKTDFDRLVKEFIAPLTERMESIWRYGTKMTIKPQNLTSHHGTVTFISMILSDYLNSVGVKNDTESVLRMAIIHDLGEIVAGDVNFSAKYEYGKESEALRGSLKKLEKKAIRSFLGKLRVPEIEERYLRLFEETDLKLNVEARIVKLADHIDVVLFARRERKLGNADMKDIEEKTHARYGRDFESYLKK